MKDLHQLHRHDVKGHHLLYLLVTVLVSLAMAVLFMMGLGPAMVLKF